MAESECHIQMFCGVRYGGRVAELWQNVRNVASCGVSVVGEWLGRGIALIPPSEENGTWLGRHV